MRYSVVVKRGPFESREEATAYAEVAVEQDEEKVQAVGIVPSSPIYDLDEPRARYKLPSERRENGAWWLK